MYMSPKIRTIARALSRALGLGPTTSKSRRCGMADLPLPPNYKYLRRLAIEGVCPVCRKPGTLREISLTPDTAVFSDGHCSICDRAWSCDWQHWPQEDPKP